MPAGRITERIEEGRKRPLPLPSDHRRDEGMPPQEVLIASEEFRPSADHLHPLEQLHRARKDLYLHGMREQPERGRYDIWFMLGYSGSQRTGIIVDGSAHDTPLPVLASDDLRMNGRQCNRRM